MTSREAFEAWWRKNTFYPAVHASTFNRIGLMLNAKGQYKMDRIEDDWLLWQAAEKAMLVGGSAYTEDDILALDPQEVIK